MKNILIVKLSAIGDVIHALPVAYLLKQQFPNVKITWVVEPPAYELLVSNPCIDKVILFEKKKFKSIKGFIREISPFVKNLRGIKYDAVLDLQGLFKSAAIAWISKGNRKIGCCDMREGSAWVSKPIKGEHYQGHIVERYLDVARELGCKGKDIVTPLQITEREAVVAEQILVQAGANIGTPYVIFAVGANWPNKRWSTTQYAELVNWLYNKKIIPVLSGAGVVDERLAGEIIAKAEIPPVNIVGKTSLKQLAHLIKKAKAMVGGDTGTVHLAAGLKVPTIMLLGPTDINRNGPYGQSDNAIEVEYDCKHCWKRVCQFDRDCISNISVEQVIDKLNKYC